MNFLLVVALIIFIVSFLTMIFEIYDKTIVAMAGAILMVIVGILDFEEAVAAIDFETIGLLLGMMIIVDLATSSGIFSWMSVKMTKLTRGRPWMIFVLFLSVTFLMSAFLDNVTTVLIIVPIVLSLTQGMGLNSRLFLIALIMFANIGGSLTLIGDPTNIIIGSAAKLTFNQFISHQIIPVGAVSIVLICLVGIFHWSTLRPISGNLKKLFVTHLLIQKIEKQFVKIQLKKSFVIAVLTILFLTISGFIFQNHLSFPISIISLAGASMLLILTSQHSSVHETFSKIEWPTLFFFIGLFIMVAGLKKVGLLDMIGHGIIGFSDNYLILVLLLLWLTGFISMVLDNIPFVTIMVPIVFQVQTTLPPTVDSTLLWWALSLGACIGGCGSPLGASCNVVSLGAARKQGITVSFLEYIKIAFPLTIVALGVCSVYFILLLS